MCGRYSLANNDMDKLARRFAVSFWEIDVRWRPSFNIAPTEDALAVILNKNGEREAALLRWGLVPYWAKDMRIGASMINAKAETLTTRAAFKESFERRRCLILADGFYEWQKNGVFKQPIRYTQADREPFAFAGLWASWEGPEGTLTSCTIVTTEPNDLVRTVHDRMPVILSEEAERIWMDKSTQASPSLAGILTPFPAGSMRATVVSQAVNSVRNKGPECAEPAGG